MAVTFPPKQKICCGHEKAISVHLPSSTRAAMQEEMPDHWMMAAGRQKDTADKCINYLTISVAN